MKSVDNTSLRSVLANTEFQYLIEKFEEAGDSNLRNLTLLNNQGQLLAYLKNFEKDELKVLKLQKIVKDALIESSKPFLNTLVIAFGIIFILILIGILSLLS
jgi:hypothetical protein